MKNDVRTSHLGVEVVLDEDANLWKCAEIDYENASLKKVRGRIDRYRSEQHAAQTIPGYYVGTDGAGQPIECEILRYIGTKSVWLPNDVQPKVHAVWHTSWGNKPAKRDTNISEIVADTPHNRAVLEYAATLRNRAQDLLEDARDKVNSLPRLTLDDIPEMVAQHEKEQGKAETA